MGKIYAGDVGVEILLNCQEDISAASVKNVIIYKPDGVELVKEALVVGGTQLQYITQEGDLDLPGVYKVQPQITLLAWAGLGETATFIVYNKGG